MELGNSLVSGNGGTITGEGARAEYAGFLHQMGQRVQFIAVGNNAYLAVAPSWAAVATVTLQYVSGGAPIYGNPQETNGPYGAEHARLSQEFGKRAALEPGVKAVYYNTPISSITEGKIVPVEIPSPGQRPQALLSKWDGLKQVARENGFELEGTRVFGRFLTRAGIPLELNGARAAVRAIEVFSIISGAIGAWRDYEDSKQMEVHCTLNDCSIHA
jgi:hypothetical protein